MSPMKQKISLAELKDRFNGFLDSSIPGKEIDYFGRDSIFEVLEDEFEHIWNYRYRGSAEKFLKRWMTAALRSRIPSLRQFVATVRNHFDNIVAFTDRNLTNAVGEGLNRIVKIVKNRASGYRNLHNFADMIYLTVGDLDIPAHIPSQLRTL